MLLDYFHPEALKDLLDVFITREAAAHDDYVSHLLRVLIEKKFRLAHLGPFEAASGMASIHLTPAERGIMLFQLPEDSAAYTVVMNARMIANAVDRSPFAYVVDCDPIDARYLKKIAMRQSRQAEWNMILAVEMSGRREPGKSRARRGRSAPLPSARQLSLGFD